MLCSVFPIIEFELFRESQGYYTFMAISCRQVVSQSRCKLMNSFRYMNKFNTVHLINRGNHLGYRIMSMRSAKTQQFLFGLISENSTEKND